MGSIKQAFGYLSQGLLCLQFSFSWMLNKTQKSFIFSLQQKMCVMQVLGTEQFCFQKAIGFLFRLQRHLGRLTSWLLVPLKLGIQSWYSSRGKSPRIRFVTWDVWDISVCSKLQCIRLLLLIQSGLGRDGIQLLVMRI